VRRRDCEVSKWEKRTIVSLRQGLLMTDAVEKVGGKRQARNNRIQKVLRLNQSCAVSCFFESKLRLGVSKIFISTASTRS
jgi:hypothetical protein